MVTIYESDALAVTVYYTSLHERRYQIAHKGSGGAVIASVQDATALAREILKMEGWSVGRLVKLE